MNDYKYITPFNTYPDPAVLSFEKYLDKVSALPKSIKSILIGFGSAEFIEEKIVPKFNLNTTQKLNLGGIIRDILILDLFLGDLVTEISSELEIDQQKAKEIANDIVSQLFSPAIEEIKVLQKQKFANRLSGTPSNQTINLRPQGAPAPGPQSSPIPRPEISRPQIQSQPQPQGSQAPNNLNQGLPPRPQPNPNLQAQKSSPPTVSLGGRVPPSVPGPQQVPTPSQPQIQNNSPKVQPIQPPPTNNIVPNINKANVLNLREDEKKT